jgi:hypothetical protein
MMLISSISDVEWRCCKCVENRSRFRSSKSRNGLAVMSGSAAAPPGTEGADLTVVHYDDAHLQIPAVVLSTFLASLLPVLSIVILYLVESMPERLAIVAVFTSAFSVALALVTTATRVENFAATAAWVPRSLLFFVGIMHRF